MTHLPFTRTALILALVGAVTLAASACGSSSGASSPSSTVTEVAGGGGGGRSGSTIDVTLKDYSITVTSSGERWRLASTRFTSAINGPLSHNLTVNGPGVTDKATPTFAPGGTEDLTVTLKNGTYDLYCSVPGHKQLGMDTHLTVGSGGAAAGGGGSTKSGGSSSSGSTASGGGWA